MTLAAPSSANARVRLLPIAPAPPETRDFTYIGNIIDGLLRAGCLEQTIGQAFNLASGTETRIVDLANMINELINNQAGLVFTERRKWDTKPRLLASIDKAKGLIGYDPKTTIEEGLQKTVSWFHEKWDLIQASARLGPGMSSAVRGLVFEDIKKGQK